MTCDQYVYVVKALPEGEDYETSNAELVEIDRFNAPHERAAERIVREGIKSGKYPADAVVDEVS